MHPSCLFVFGLVGFTLGDQFLETTSPTIVDTRNATTVILSQEGGIRGYPWGHPEQSYMIQNSHFASVATYNARGDYVYCTNDENEIWRSRLNGSEKQVVLKGFRNPIRLAYDWIQGNMYFTDDQVDISSTVVVCSGNFTFCYDLNPKGIATPVDLALDPNQGLIFVVDLKGFHLGQVYIYRMGMDGTDPIPIIRDNIFWPSGITVDVAASRIYWSDFYSDIIETARYDGTDRRVINSHEGLTPIGIDVLGDLLITANFQTYEVQAINKFDGSNRVTLFTAPSEQMVGLVVFHEGNQPITRKNQCKDAGCSQICALGPNNSFRCLSPAQNDSLVPKNKTSPNQSILSQSQALLERMRLAYNRKRVCPEGLIFAENVRTCVPVGLNNGRSMRATVVVTVVLVTGAIVFGLYKRVF